MKLRLLIVLALFSLNTVLSQSFQWESFTKENSPLPDNSLRALHIDENEVLWIGSDSGLTGFNGSAWITYTTSNTDSLADDQINDILISDQDIVLSGPKGLSGGEITTYDNINWSTPLNTKNSGLARDMIFTSNIDSLGNKWFGTDSGVSLMKPDNSWELFSLGGVFPFISVNKQPTYWQHFGTKGLGVYILGYTNNGSSDAITSATWLLEPWNLISDTVQAVFIEEDGDRWYGTPRGVTYHTGPNLRSYTWYNVNSGLVHNNVQALAQDSDSAMWIGTSGGVSRFYNSSWNNFTTGNGLISDDVRDIEPAPGNIVWFATAGGLSKLTISSSSIKTDNPVLADNFIVSPAFPNPFNMTTHIKFELPVASQVRIKIYSINGQLVNELLNADLMKGKYDIVWTGKNNQGSDIASGLYHAVISAANQIKVIKLVLLK
ncbi:MAG: T9SS type A sorting domain-containing protein [Calditrichaceae bacterium]|nr:T9SS type A sorting domain-containing protein [Calditrichaceae bacterium]MBN2710175.1 T9SS type A sorting domain-containing protein [Calditrichaceae bacterium]RQV94151.1 MAG: T9SS C-terminal target domain-containing protein [Calditrichota bacterium]